MIDTFALKTAIIDLAVKGQLSSQFQVKDSVDDIIEALPMLSNKRKKLLWQSFEYGKQETIPVHWKWMRLGEISSYGDTPQKAYFDDVSGDTWILDLEDIKSGGQIIKKTRVKGKNFIGDKTVFKKGQVLYSKLRPYLKKVLVADEDGISTPELVSFDLFGEIVPQYVVYCLLSSYTGRAIDKRSYGIKMPRIDAGFMINLPIPVPPISEQKYIVDRVQQAFTALDTVDALQTQYADNLTVLKSKLIDAAIQGKLTEQLPEDGTAEELLARVNSEKRELIAAGKIPKEKGLPDIESDEIPFSVPHTWKWVHVQDVASYITDYVANGSFSTLKAHTKTYKKPNYALFVRTVDLSAGFKGECSYIDKPSYDFLQKSQLFGGELILPNIGASIGKAFIMPNMGMPMSLAPNAILLKFTEPIINEYFSYVVKSTYGNKILNKTQGGSATAKFSKTDLRALVVPLPPLSEIIRIVSVLNNTLRIIDAQFST